MVIFGEIAFGSQYNIKICAQAYMSNCNLHPIIVLIVIFFNFIRQIVMMQHKILGAMCFIRVQQETEMMHSKIHLKYQKQKSSR